MNRDQDSAPQKWAEPSGGLPGPSTGSECSEIQRTETAEKPHTLGEPGKAAKEKKLKPVKEGVKRALPKILKPSRTPRELRNLESCFRMIGGGTDPSSDASAYRWLSSQLPNLVSSLECKFDYEKPSIQRLLLEHVERQRPELRAQEQLAAARKVQRENIRDIACTIMTGRSYHNISPLIADSMALTSTALNMRLILPESSGLVERAMRVDSGALRKDLPAGLSVKDHALARLAAAFPEQVLPCEMFREAMDRALLEKRGMAFIAEVAKEAANVTTETKYRGVGDLLLVTSLNWTNPDFPLWLAEAGAFVEMLGEQFRVSGVSRDAAKRMRSRRFEGRGLQLIRGFRVSESGAEFNPVPGFSLPLWFTESNFPVSC